MIHGKNIFDQPINSNLKTYENIRKIATGKRDDYKMIAINLSKPQSHDADTRAIQQINFTANLGRTENTTTFFIITEAKKTVLDFSQVTVKAL